MSWVALQLWMQGPCPAIFQSWASGDLHVLEVEDAGQKITSDLAEVTRSWVEDEGLDIPHLYIYMYSGGL